MKKTDVPQVDPASVQAAKEEAKSINAFIEAYNKLCEEFGFVIVARGQLQNVEGAVFRVVATLEVAKKPPKQEIPS